MPATNIPAVNAGALDKRVTLLRPVYNEWQDEVASWEPVSEVWASIGPVLVTERNEADRIVSWAQVPIVIRYRADLDPRWRIQYRTHTYEIDGMRDILARHVQLELTCKEVV